MKFLLLSFIVLASLALFAYTNPCPGSCGFSILEPPYSDENVKNTTEKGFLTYKDLVKRGEAGGQWWWYTPKIPKADDEFKEGNLKL